MGTEAAYKAVMKPKEGTMLTVSRLMSDAVNKAAAKGADAYQIIDVMLQSGEAALKKLRICFLCLKKPVLSTPEAWAC